MGGKDYLYIFISGQLMYTLPYTICVHYIESQASTLDFVAPYNYRGRCRIMKGGAN